MIKKQIEKALPLRELINSAQGDKAYSGHPGNMHMWWRRSPIDSSEELLKAILSNNDSKDDIPVLCDPFSGFGGLSIAGQKAGFNVKASDLNSVATLLSKAAVEIPSLFVNTKPVNPDAENKYYFNSEGLSADVTYYGEFLKRIVYEKIRDLYPLVNVPETNEEFPAYAWIWVRTMRCPNPACACEMPLSTSYVLSKAKNMEYWAEPVIIEESLHFKIHQGVCPKDKETNKHGSIGSKFQCPVCGQLTTNEEVKQAGKEDKLNIKMMAVSALTGNGRVFVEPDATQIIAGDIDRDVTFPIEKMPNNTRWFSPPGFGMTEYSDLYIGRQLRLLNTFCDSIAVVMKRIEKDALNAGMINDQIPLSEHGTGVFAYSQAVGVYLALVISKLANYHSKICTWDNRKGNIRAAFTRQAIPMTWVFAEGNPFCSATGNYNSMLKSVAESVKQLSVGIPADVKQADALIRDYPDNSILFTELPYYDNIGYADLSDYFYIWLRKCLKDVFPDLFEKMVTSKEELCSIPEHYDGDAKKAVEEYREGIKKFFKQFYPSASKEYPSVVFYEYTKIDDQIIKGIQYTDDSSAIEHIISCLIDTGYIVTAIWPIRTEQVSDKFDSIRIAIVFRKKEENNQKTTRRGFINTLKREVPDMLSEAFKEEMDEIDRPIVGLGFGLSVFTRYKNVINADGTNMSVHDSLQIIYQETIDYLDRLQVDEKTGEE